MSAEHSALSSRARYSCKFVPNCNRSQALSKTYALHARTHTDICALSLDDKFDGALNIIEHLSVFSVPESESTFIYLSCLNVWGTHIYTAVIRQWLNGAELSLRTCENDIVKTGSVGKGCYFSKSVTFPFLGKTLCALFWDESCRFFSHTPGELLVRQTFNTELNSVPLWQVGYSIKYSKCHCTKIMINCILFIFKKALNTLSIHRELKRCQEAVILAKCVSHNHLFAQGFYFCCALYIWYENDIMPP